MKVAAEEFIRRLLLRPAWAIHGPVGSALASPALGGCILGWRHRLQAHTFVAELARGASPGGTLTMHNDTVQGTTSYSDAAISVTGGIVNLGTTASPGNNVINAVRRRLVCAS